MPEPASIQVSGNVNGSIVVGDHNFVVNTNHGTIIYQQAPPQVRPHPTMPQAPRPQYGFVNRTAELTQLENAIRTGGVVLLHGADGMGKSSMLQQAASSAAAKAMPNGVITLENLDVNGQTLGANDIIQLLFDTFFESNPPLKVNEITARTHLSNTRPLIVLDEVSLSPALQRALPNLFPQGAMLISADVAGGMNFERLSIGPLPPAEALTLLAAKAELTLNNINRAAMEKICEQLGNIPLALVVTGNILRETHTSPDAALLSIQAIAAPERDPARAALNRAFGFAFGLLRPEEKQAISAAALTPGVSMTPAWLSAALGGVSLETFLAHLKALGLLHEEDSRLSLPPGFIAPAQNATVLSKETVMSRLISYLRAPLQANPENTGHIQAELGSFFGALTWAAQTGRSADVIALGRAIDPYLTTHGLWDAWGTVSNYVLDAARLSGEKAVEAWALHQLGTRAIGLEMKPQALDLLRQALEIRRALGDVQGAAYTQHNINLLVPPAPPRNNPPKSQATKTKAGGPNWFLVTGGIIVLGLLALLLIVGVLLLPDIFPTPAPTVTDIHTPLPDDTLAPPPTDAPTLEILQPTATAPLPSTLTVASFTPTIAPVLSVRMVNKLKDMPVLYQGNDEEDYFEIPVTINIKGQGNLGADHSNVAIRLNDGSLAPFRLDDENSYLVKRDFNFSTTLSLPLNLKISKKYQGKTITIQSELEICEAFKIECLQNPLKIKLPAVVYDFIGQAQDAIWKNFNPETGTADELPFNDGLQSNRAGFVNVASYQELEDGTIPGYVLFTHPIWDVANGEILGRYENGKISPLDSNNLLVVRVGFIKVDGGVDGVTFSIGYENSFKSNDLFQIHDDGANGILKNKTINLPDELISRNFSYMYLRVNAGNTSNSDWAAWVSAYIARP